MSTISAQGILAVINGYLGDTGRVAQLHFLDHLIAFDLTKHLHRI